MSTCAEQSIRGNREKYLKVSKFISFAHGYPIVPAPLVEKTIELSWYLCQKSDDHKNVRISGLSITFH